MLYPPRARMGVYGRGAGDAYAITLVARMDVAADAVALTTTSFAFLNVALAFALSFLAQIAHIFALFGECTRMNRSSQISPLFGCQKPAQNKAKDDRLFLFCASLVFIPGLPCLSSWPP